MDFRTSAFFFIGLGVFAGLACGCSRSSKTDLRSWAENGDFHDVKRVLLLLPESRPQSTACAQTLPRRQSACIAHEVFQAFTNQYSQILAIEASESITFQKPIWHWSASALSVTVNPPALKRVLSLVEPNDMEEARSASERVITTNAPAAFRECEGVAPSSPPCRDLNCKWGLDNGFRGQGTHVAVIDSPVPDEFWTRVSALSGYKLAEQNGTPLWAIARPEVVGSIYSDENHGRDVAALIRGTTDSATGAAPDSRLIYFPACCGTDPVLHSSEVINALELSSLLGVDAANLSLGWQHPTESLQELWRRFAGYLSYIKLPLFVAAGNEGNSGNNSLRWPAVLSSEFVVSVGSLVPSEYGWKRAPFSSFGAAGPVIAAPGCNLAGAFGNFSGTSASTPLVTGVFLQLRSAYAQLSASELVTALKLQTGTKSARTGEPGLASLPEAWSALKR
jgi:subtilisin family serine protease